MNSQDTTPSKRGERQETQHVQRVSIGQPVLPICSAQDSMQSRMGKATKAVSQTRKPATRHRRLRLATHTNVPSPW